MCHYEALLASHCVLLKAIPYKSYYCVLQFEGNNIGLRDYFSLCATLHKVHVLPQNYSDYLKVFICIQYVTAGKYGMEKRFFLL